MQRSHSVRRGEGGEEGRMLPILKSKVIWGRGLRRRLAQPWKAAERQPYRSLAIGGTNQGREVVASAVSTRR